MKNIRIVVFVLALAGCGRGQDEDVRLVLISPHRDEIRQEYDLAYPDWIARRTRDRADAALNALDAKDPDRIEAAMTALLDDWDRVDAGDLYSAYDAWKANHEADALRRAVTAWRGRARKVDLVWQDVGGGTSAIARYVRSSYAGAEERGKKGIGVDLVFGGGTDIYLRFIDEGFLQPVELPADIMKRIPAELNGNPMYDPKHRWYGPTLSTFGILSNRWVLERMGLPEPKTWSDLGQPEFLSWITAGDPRMSGSIHMVYEIILQGPLGWDNGFGLLLRMGANTHTFVRDSGTLTRAVNDGQVAAGGNLDVNALSAVGRNPRMMTYVLPQGQTIINPDAIAMLRDNERPKLARSFIIFTMSLEGQKMLMLQPGTPGGPRKHAMCRLSVIPELYAEIPVKERSTGSVNPFLARGTIHYDSKLGFKRWDALNDLIGAWIVDAHAELTAAGRAVKNSSLTGEERAEVERELYAPPCTIEDLTKYAEHLSDGDARFRAMRLTEWGKQARERYRRVRERCQ